MTDREIINLWDEVQVQFSSIEYCNQELKALPKGAPMFPDQNEALARADRRRECDAIVAFAQQLLAREAA